MNNKGKKGEDSSDNRQCFQHNWIFHKLPHFDDYQSSILIVYERIIVSRLLYFHFSTLLNGLAFIKKSLEIHDFE